MSARPITGVIITCLSTLLLLTGCDLLKKTNAVAVVSETQWAEDQLATIRLRYIYLTEDLEHLQRAKNLTVEKLHEQGVKNATDRQQTPQIEHLVKTLQLQAESLRKANARQELYQQAIVRLEAKVRSLRLEAAPASLPQNSVNDSLEVIIRQLDGQLKNDSLPQVIQEMELDELVNREMESYRNRKSVPEIQLGDE